MSSYERAGISIALGERLAQRAQRFTGQSGFAGELGGLMATTDGVGTKILLALEHDQHEGIGQDLLAMVSNDLVAAGAEPQLMLDYLAHHSVPEGVLERVIDSVGHACAAYAVPLVGGETAQLPDLLQPGMYDLAGFAVGKRTWKAPRAPKPGDPIVGLSSSGLHSNGFTLVRALGGGAELLTPTRVYSLANLPQRLAAAHVTGGGIRRALSRLYAGPTEISLPAPDAAHRWLLAHDVELEDTFNCGVGMVLVVPPAELTCALALPYALELGVCA